MTWKEAQLTLQLMSTERIGVQRQAAARQSKEQEDAALERMRAMVAADQ